MAKAFLEISVFPAWENIVTEMDVDVMPKEENHIVGSKCPCEPEVEVYGGRLLVIHNSYDKREFIEQAIDIMNGNA